MISVRHTDGFYDAINGFINNSPAIAKLNEKILTVGDANASYRLLNHWCDIGLIDDERPSDSKWKKFSIKELVLIGIYVELRKYGFSIETITNVKKCLLDGVEKNPYCEKDVPAAPLVEFAVICCQRLKKQFFLIVGRDGSAGILTEPDLSLTDTMYGYQDYLRLNLNNLLSSIFPNIDFEPEETGNIAYLSSNEFKVLTAIRLDDCKEINIKMRDGQISQINKKAIPPEGGTLRDIVSSLAFGDITIKKENGKIVFTEVFEKEKV